MEHKYIFRQPRIFLQYEIDSQIVKLEHFVAVGIRTRNFGVGSDSSVNCVTNKQCSESSHTITLSFLASLEFIDIGKLGHFLFLIRVQHIAALGVVKEVTLQLVSLRLIIG